MPVTQFKGGKEMNGSSTKLRRLLLPVGALVFCASLMARAVPANQDPQQTPPDNTKQNKDQTNPTADQQKMNPADRTITQKIRKAIHDDVRAQHQNHHARRKSDTPRASAV
jgi:hypothetical protein